MTAKSADRVPTEHKGRSAQNAQSGPPARDRPARVLVAGTSFGRVYVDAVRSAPDRFELAGLLARGSDYSRAYAQEQSVPLYTDPDQVPDDVDIACVVLRTSVIGGPGTGIAQAFLRRGIAVLQEHPLHANDVVACLQAARDGEACYRISTLYPDIAPVARFLTAAAALRAHQRPLFVDAACSTVVAYPMLDVVGRAVGALRPWAIGPGDPVPAEVSAVTGDAQPFRTLHAAIGSVPATLRVQNQICPSDPDNHTLLLHRIAVGFEAGVLTLADSHGPVLWNPRLHAPRDEAGRLRTDGPGAERLDVPSTVELTGPGPARYREVIGAMWPRAVLAALDRLWAERLDPAAQSAAGRWAASVAQIWADLGDRLGPPELIEPAEPAPLDLSVLVGPPPESDGGH